jgi:hypothetical protein
MSDLTRLVTGLNHQHAIEGVSADFRVIMKLSRLLREADWKVTATLVLTKKGYKLINVEPGDTTRQNYSIVVDIGPRRSSVRSSISTSVLSLPARTANVTERCCSPWPRHRITTLRSVTGRM